MDRMCSPISRCIGSAKPRDLDSGITIVNIIIMFKMLTFSYHRYLIAFEVATFGRFIHQFIITMFITLCRYVPEGV